MSVVKVKVNINVGKRARQPEEMSVMYSITLLGLAPDPMPTLEQCKKQYRALALRFHPDKRRRKEGRVGSHVLDDPSLDDQARMDLINRAWEVIRESPDMQPPDPEELERKQKIRHEQVMTRIAATIPDALFERTTLTTILDRSVRTVREIPLRILATRDVPDGATELEVAVKCKIRCDGCRGRGIVLPDNVDRFDRCGDCKGTSVRSYLVILSRIAWVAEIFVEAQRRSGKGTAATYEDVRASLGENAIMNRLRECGSVDIAQLYRFYSDPNMRVPEDLPPEQYVMNLGHCNSCFGVGIENKDMRLTCRWCKGQGYLIVPFTFTIKNARAALEQSQRNGRPYVHAIQRDGKLWNHQTAITVLLK